MCIDSDLFDDVIVTVNEVDTWLDAMANMQGRSQTSREHYAKTYGAEN